MNESCIQTLGTMAEWSKATDLRSVTRTSAQVRTLLVPLIRNLTAIYILYLNYDPKDF